MKEVKEQGSSESGFHLLALKGTLLHKVVNGRRHMPIAKIGQLGIRFLPDRSLSCSNKWKNLLLQCTFESCRKLRNIFVPKKRCNGQTYAVIILKVVSDVHCDRQPHLFYEIARSI